MRITADRDKCIGLGLCEAEAPGYFAVDDDGLVVLLADDVDAGHADAVRAAVAACPTLALRLADG
ncbi:ferredoxin [Cryptosporangium phraense]|nr:ferredoxin [Cryptosporangium phraense]